MTAFSDFSTVAYAPVAERVQAQQEQIEYLSAQSTRLIQEAQTLKATQGWKECDRLRDKLAEADKIYREQRERDRRLCFHISRTETLRKQASFFNPVRRCPD